MKMKKDPIQTLEALLNRKCKTNKDFVRLARELSAAIRWAKKSHPTTKKARALLRRLKRAGYVKARKRRFYRGGLPGLGKRR